MRFLIDSDGLSIVCSWWFFLGAAVVWLFYKFIWQKPEDMRP